MMLPGLEIRSQGVVWGSGLWGRALGLVGMLLTG